MDNKGSDDVPQRAHIPLRIIRINELTARATVGKVCANSRPKLMQHERLLLNSGQSVPSHRHGRRTAIGVPLAWPGYTRYLQALTDKLNRTTMVTRLCKLQECGSIIAILGTRRGTRG